MIHYYCILVLYTTTIANPSFPVVDALFFSNNLKSQSSPKSKRNFTWRKINDNEISSLSDLT
jgi:hypothetical protein